VHAICGRRRADDRPSRHLLALRLAPAASERGDHVVEVAANAAIEGDHSFGRFTRRRVRWKTAQVVELCSSIEAVDAMLVTRRLLAPNRPQQA
jgi:hypothetical protein